MSYDTIYLRYIMVKLLICILQQNQMLSMIQVIYGPQIDCHPERVWSTTETSTGTDGRGYVSLAMACSWMSQWTDIAVEGAVYEDRYVQE